MHVALQSLQQGGWAVPDIELRVLEGGFDQWVRRYWNDPLRVDGYDDAYWGFVPLACCLLMVNRLTVGYNDGGELAHSLYTRPADQCATPWSQAGTGASR